MGEAVLMVTTATRRVDNLPADLSRLVGRRAESAHVKRLLAQSRLVTLTGVGGVGKTRLAVHVARQVRAAFPDGVCLVRLADLTTSELLATSVMSALSHSGTASAGVMELVEHLASREMLLLIDNCEHLARPVAELVTTLLRRCSDLRVLATSQERLRVEGEAVYAVPPLALPGAGQRVTPDDILRYDALALFLERASALRPDLAVGPTELESIVALCRRLDGLPLAIELMAGRTSALPIQALVSRLDDISLLDDGSWSSPARHQTLRAAVEYSHALCSDPARLLWTRISVFAGSASLEAVREVCADEQLTAVEVELALRELVEKSIVGFDGSRYHLLETIRAYGRERLRETGERERLQLAHRDYYSRLAAPRFRDLPAGGSRTGFKVLRAEVANLRAALAFCCDEPEQVESGLTMAECLWPFWAGSGLQGEGRHWLGQLLAGAERSSTERINGLWVDGVLAALDRDTAKALSRAEECAELADRLDDPAGLAHAAFVRGHAKLFSDEQNEAAADLELAVRLERQIPMPNPVLGYSLLALGIASCMSGQLDRAEEVLTEARSLAEVDGEPLQQVGSLTWLGVAALLGGRYEEATTRLKQVLVDARSGDDLLGVSGAVEFLAWTAAETGDDERAARLHGLSQLLAERVVSQLGASPGLRRWHEDWIRKLRERLGERAFERAVALGREMPVDDGIAFALELRGAPTRSREVGERLPLTKREREVAELVAQGQSNREIAANLVISVRTAEAHVEHILAKLGLTSRAQVIALLAQRSGSSGQTR